MPIPETSFIEIFKILKFRQPYYMNPLSYPGQLQDPLVMAVLIRQRFHVTSSNKICIRYNMKV